MREMQCLKRSQKSYSARCCQLFLTSGVQNTDDCLVLSNAVPAFQCFSPVWLLSIQNNPENWQRGNLSYHVFYYVLWSIWNIAWKFVCPKEGDTWKDHKVFISLKFWDLFCLNALVYPQIPCHPHECLILTWILCFYRKLHHVWEGSP